MKKGKKIIIIFASLLIILGIITTVICISNPLFAVVLFSAKTDYQVTHIRGGDVDENTVGKKELMDLFIGKKIVRDDSQKGIGDKNGACVYLIAVKGDEIMAYYDHAPSDAVVSYQGKYYRITNPKYPIGF